MRGKYPKVLRKIKVEEELIPQRFLQASKGWIRYKPLLTYISDEKNYKMKMEDTRRQLEVSLPEINKLFKDYDFSILLDEFNEYCKNVEKHHKEYLKTNEIWDKLKSIQFLSN